MEEESSLTGGMAWREFFDLFAAVAAVIVTGFVVFLPVISETPIRIIAGLAFVLFVPGYAFIAVLFPGEGTEGSDGQSASGIDWLERLVLSFGSSVALVPLVGLLLNFTPWGIRLVPVFVSLAAVTLALTGVAVGRRARLLAERRLQVPTTSVDAVRAELLEPTDRTDAVLNVLVVVSLLVAMSSVAFAVGAPTQGETYTEFYLLTENDSGALVADDYPEELTVGESSSLVVGLTNQERQATNYTVVVELQNVSVVDGDVVVEERTELRRYTPQVAANATWTRTHAVQPEHAGENRRLAYHLYRGTAENPDTVDAYRNLYLWVDVNQTHS